MADIRRFLWLRHLRAEPSQFIIHHSGDKLVRKGRGLAFWFWPLKSSISQIPLDDRELTFHFHGLSRDFQDVTIQGVITYRLEHPEIAASRVDFSIDPRSGHYLHQPLENLSQLMTQLAQQYAWTYVVNAPLRRILTDGWEELRQRIGSGLVEDGILQEMGLEIVSVRVSSISPTSEVQRALQMPTLETIQQQADEATFQRRALAVEKERAIQENELQNQIELARREEKLIDQRGLNSRREAEEQAEAAQIAMEAKANREKVRSEAEAKALERVDGTKVALERDRIAIYRELEGNVLLGLAARELAQNLPHIDYVNVSPDLLQPLIARLGRTDGAGATDD